MVSLGPKALRALYRNRPFWGTWAMKSSTEQALVTLQRPFPVIITLRAIRGLRSTTVTGNPRRPAMPAATKPAAPPPMIRQRRPSLSISRFLPAGYSFSFHSFGSAVSAKG